MRRLEIVEVAVNRRQIFSFNVLAQSENIQIPYRGNIFVGETYSSGKHIRRGNIFVGEKFRQLSKISSIFPDELFPDKVSS